MENNQDTKKDTLALSIADKINFEVLKDVLVKPLEPIKIKKQFTVPVTDKKAKDDGIEVNDYKETKTEIREVESNFAKGVVLKVPIDSNAEFPYAIGDTVVYNKRFSVEFDLFKNSVLVKPYDIVAIEK